MERTELINKPGDEYNAPQRWWRVRFHKVQLKCPNCHQWFKLGDDFKIDDDGVCDSVVYHVCDNDREGWVVLPQLVGWNK